MERLLLQIAENSTMIEKVLGMNHGHLTPVDGQRILAALEGQPSSCAPQLLSPQLQSIGADLSPFAFATTSTVGIRRRKAPAASPAMACGLPLTAQCSSERIGDNELRDVAALLLAPPASDAPDLNCVEQFKLTSSRSNSSETSERDDEQQLKQTSLHINAKSDSLQDDWQGLGAGPSESASDEGDVSPHKRRGPNELTDRQRDVLEQTTRRRRKSEGHSSSLSNGANNQTLVLETIWGFIARKVQQTSLSSYSPSVMACDIAYIILTGATSLCTSLLVALLWSTTPVAVYEPRYIGLVVVYEICQFFFGVWMILQPFVQTLKGTWGVQDHIKTIGGNYLTSRWFVLDAFLTVPLEVVVIPWSPAAATWVMLRCLLRWVRVWSVLYRVSNPLHSSRFSLFVVALSVVIVTCCSWLCVFLFVFSHGVESAVNVVMFNVNTMATVGLEDPSPLQDTVNGMPYFALINLVGATLSVSLATAVMTRYLSYQDPLDKEINTKKSLLNSMFLHYRIPWSLQREIIPMFPRLIQHDNQIRIRSVVDALPHAVRVKLIHQIKSSALMKVEMFHTLHQSLRNNDDHQRSGGDVAVVELALASEDMVASAGMNLLHADTSFIVVLQGSCQVIHNTSRCDVLSVSSVDKDAAVLTLHSGAGFYVPLYRRAVHEMFAVISLQATHVLTLCRSDFEEWALRFPIAAAQVLQLAKDFHKDDPCTYQGEEEVLSSAGSCGMPSQHGMMMPAVSLFSQHNADANPWEAVDEGRAPVGNPFEAPLQVLSPSVTLT